MPLRSPVSIATARFILRELCVEDVSEKYLGWLRDKDVERWISASDSTEGLLDLERYVSSRIRRDDVLFLGIFEKKCGAHIGNIKYEPLLRDDGTAVMGVLIGDQAFRGKGVFTEVFRASATWLKFNCQINRIYLVVDAANVSAVRAYLTAGFVIEPSSSSPTTEGALKMVFFA